jgi:hypothetical protein
MRWTVRLPSYAHCRAIRRPFLPLFLTDCAQSIQILHQESGPTIHTYGHNVHCTQGVVHTQSHTCFSKGGFLEVFKGHCFICRPSDSSALEDDGIETRTVATLALAVRRSNHSARCLDLIHSTVDLVHTRLHRIRTRLDLIHKLGLDLIRTRIDIIHTQLDLIHTRLGLINTKLDLIHHSARCLDLIHTRLDLIHN